MPDRPPLFPTLLQSGLFVALSDGLFASLTGILIKPYATPFRVFRGVASVLFGPDALNGGTPFALLGICMHIITATWWSLVFILILRASRHVRQAIMSGPGAVIVALCYGPAIWLFMSLVFIPSMVHRMPTLGAKWWVQLVGHALFVVGPMIVVNRRAMSLFCASGLAGSAQH
jgi:hypothetical protein